MAGRFSRPVSFALTIDRPARILDAAAAYSGTAGTPSAPTRCRATMWPKPPARARCHWPATEGRRDRPVACAAVPVARRRAWPCGVGFAARQRASEPAAPAPAVATRVLPAFARTPPRGALPLMRGFAATSGTHRELSHRTPPVLVTQDSFHPGPPALLPAVSIVDDALHLNLTRRAPHSTHMALFAPAARDARAEKASVSKPASAVRRMEAAGEPRCHVWKRVVPDGRPQPRRGAQSASTAAPRERTR